MNELRIYPHARFDTLFSSTIDRLKELSTKKGGEYCGSDDRLENFRRNAAYANTTMEFVWRIFAAKHWDSLMQYEKDLRTGVTRERMEAIEGRVDDLILYLLLFKAMIEERNIT